MLLLAKRNAEEKVARYQAQAVRDATRGDFVSFAVGMNAVASMEREIGMADPKDEKAQLDAVVKKLKTFDRLGRNIYTALTLLGFAEVRDDPEKEQRLLKLAREALAQATKDEPAHPFSDSSGHHLPLPIEPSGSAAMPLFEADLATLAKFEADLSRSPRNESPRVKWLY